MSEIKIIHSFDGDSTFIDFYKSNTEWFTKRYHDKWIGFTKNRYPLDFELHHVLQDTHDEVTKVGGFKNITLVIFEE